MLVVAIVGSTRFHASGRPGGGVRDAKFQARNGPTVKQSGTLTSLKISRSVIRDRTVARLDLVTCDNTPCERTGAEKLLERLLPPPPFFFLL